jgi:hypothetical protein
MSRNASSISAIGPERNRTIAKLIEQARNFQKEYRFLKYWAAGSDKTGDCQVKALLVQTS